MALDRSTPRQTAATSPVDWPALLALHERWLRTVLFAHVGDAWAVDDVWQEVAAACITDGDTLRDPTKAGAWLYRLAVLKALQYRRGHGRSRGRIERYAERHPPTDADHRELDPLDWLLADERQSLVRQALGTLPNRDAEVLLLKYTEDWTYQQLADRLGLTTSAVEARLHRARRKMRRALAQLEPHIANT